MTSTAHAYYHVDPTVLPPAGVKSYYQEAASQLATRREQLTRQLIDHKAKSFKRIGETSVYGHSPRIEDNSERFFNTQSKNREGRQLGLSTDATLNLVSRRMAPRHCTQRTDPRLRSAACSQVPPGMALLIDGFRARMQTKGLDSALHLEDFFKKIDTDGSGYLCYKEFREGLVSHGLLSNDGEVEMLFTFFDEDRTGYIEWREFLEAVKGQLPAVRKAVVHEAFRAVDTNGSGVLDEEDLKLKFRTFNHPDVLSGKRTEAQVFEEFLGAFDCIEKDGKVTLAEFEKYYEYTSSVTASDELFVATVRNAWGLPGSGGGHCLKCQVTYGDPTTGRDDDAYRHPKDPRRRGFFNGAAQTRQEMVEIKPDPCVNRSDPKFFEIVRERLEAMGYEGVTNIEVLGRY